MSFTTVGVYALDAWDDVADEDDWYGAGADVEDGVWASLSGTSLYWCCWDMGSNYFDSTR